MQPKRLLLTSVFGPYGVKDRYGEDLGCQMELLNNQITRQQGIHSPRQAYWSFGLYLLAKNVSVATTVLDFPSWRDFTHELNRGYSHVGISFIVPNVMKARRMAQYIRTHHPETEIILGGYGTIIPNLQQWVPHDVSCRGEGVSWLRAHLGEDPTRPLEHPTIVGPAYEAIYGYTNKRPRGGILMPGLGCENGCAFCVTSHNFNRGYVPLLDTGAQVFAACRANELETGSKGFSIMDENFLKHPDRARELLAEMERHNQPYVFDLFSSAEAIRDLGVDFLVRLGVRLLWIGVESRRADYEKNKGIDVAALIRELQDNGIIVQASAILFQDHHTPETIGHDIDWAIGLGSAFTQFMNYTPYPSTALYNRLEKQGRLNHLHYRHQHGQGALAFDHPHFPDPADHVRILRDAFRQKYERHGPGVLSMAEIALRGFLKAKRDAQRRRDEKLGWQPETQCYGPQGTLGVDHFMTARLRRLEYIAMKMRPLLLPAWVFAPNAAARQKARATMRLYQRVFGPQTARERLRGLALVVTGAVEAIRLSGHRLLGHEAVVRQPPCRRTEYPAEVGAAVIDPRSAVA